MPAKDMNWGSTLWLVVHHVHLNSMKNKKGTMIGVTTVFIVVFFVGLLQNVLLRSPLIFIRLAETQAGEVDMLITPSAISMDKLLDIGLRGPEDARFLFLDATELQQKLEGNPLILGSSPRWITRGSIEAKDSTDGDRIITNILVCDLRREQELEIGRGWSYRYLGEGEAHVTSSVLSSLGIEANQGDRVKVDIGFGKLLSSLGISTTTLKDMLLSSITAEGITLHLNGTLIAEQLAARGFPVPPGLLPERIDTRVPVARVVDVEALIANTIDAVANGHAMDLELVVADAIESTFDRWPPIGNVVLLEARHLLSALRAAANRLPLVQMLNLAALANRTGSVEAAALSLDTPVADALFSFDLRRRALALAVQFRDRIRVYSQGTAGTLRDTIAVANAVGTDLAFNASYTLTLPVADALEPLKYLRIFLQQIFNSVIFVLVVHGGITIFALLLTDNDKKTYEYGMLRMLGMGRVPLGELLAVQAAYYAAPGAALGLAAAALASRPVLSAVCAYAGVPPDQDMQPDAAALAAVLGLMMPFVANVVPMRRVLSRTLGESLDIYHQTTSETSVTRQRLEDLGLSPPQTALALGLVFAGGLIYYVIPMAFIFRDFDLLLSALNAILMSTVIGLVLLSAVAQPAAEAAVARALVWGADRRMLDVVLKNLASHRGRSRKTALLFTSTLAFLIFASAMFKLQAESILGNVRVLLGSDLRVESFNGPLDELGLSAHLDRLRSAPRGPPPGPSATFRGPVGGGGAASRRRVVEDYAWVSWPLWNIDPPIQTTRISNLVGFPTTHYTEVTSISANYLDVTYGDYFLPQSTDGCGGAAAGPSGCVRELAAATPETALRVRSRDRVSALSDRPPPPPPCAAGASVAPGAPCTGGISGSLELDVIVPSSLGSTIGAEVGVPLALIVVGQSTRGGNSRQNFYLQATPKALVSKMPGMFFSSYGASTAVSPPPTLVSEATYQRLLELTAAEVGLNATARGLPTRPPKRILHVRLSDDATERERLAVMDGIRPFLNDDVTVEDTRSYVALTANTVDLLMVFFYVVAVIASVLCFFVLFTTFEANVRDHLWEFGVLRALGTDARRLGRVFIYEALSVMAAAVALGTAIGAAVAVALTMQQGLFTEMPFRLVFPWQLLLTVVAVSVAVAGLGAAVPVRSILNRPIAQVLKGT